MKKEIILCAAVLMAAVSEHLRLHQPDCRKNASAAVKTRRLFPILPTRMAYSEGFIIIRLLPIKRYRDAESL